MDIETIRSNNLKHLIKVEFSGNMAQFANKLSELTPDDTNIAANSVYRFFIKGKNARKISTKFSRRIEKAFDLSHGWMDSPQYNLKEPDISNDELINDPTKTNKPTYSNNVGNVEEIYIIDYITAGNWGDIEDPFEPGDGYETVASIRQNSSHCFALLIDGESMTAPLGADDTFPHGHIVHINPDKQAENGSFIAAKRKGHEKATFKQLRYDEGTPFLHSLNPSPAYPDIFDEFEIIGVLFMVSKKY